MHDVHTIVVGAGVVGLAVARQLSEQHQSVLVLEENPHFGSETSARHSEVIHAGIYYEKNSLKATLCVRGKELLYEHCSRYGVNHRRVQKIIVATNPSQLEKLDGIADHARDNGVTDLEELNTHQVSKLEPHIKSNGGLLSPSTGIVDSHGLMLSLVGIAESNATLFAYNTPVQNVVCINDGFEVSVGGSEPMSLRCKELVNAAGHGAVPVAKTIEGLAQHHVPEAVFSKGNYFRLQGKAPTQRLIYPVPVPGGLGVHITIDLAGQARFGPDVEWQHALNYEVDANRASDFYDAVRCYWPELPSGKLVPDYAGVRPKIKFGNNLHTDFVIQGKEIHGVEGLINLFGIESPGLTSCLAIAEHVQGLLSA